MSSLGDLSIRVDTRSGVILSPDLVSPMKIQKIFDYYTGRCSTAEHGCSGRTATAAAAAGGMRAGSPPK